MQEFTQEMMESFYHITNAASGVPMDGITDKGGIVDQYQMWNPKELRRVNAYISAILRGQTLEPDSLLMDLRTRLHIIGIDFEPIEVSGTDGRFVVQCSHYRGIGWSSNKNDVEEFETAVGDNLYLVLDYWLNDEGYTQIEAKLIDESEVEDYVDDELEVGEDLQEDISDDTTGEYDDPCDSCGEFSCDCENDDNDDDSDSENDDNDDDSDSENDDNDDDSDSDILDEAKLPKDIVKKNGKVRVIDLDGEDQWIPEKDYVYAIEYGYYPSTPEGLKAYQNKKRRIAEMVESAKMNRKTHPDLEKIADDIRQQTDGLFPFMNIIAEKGLGDYVYFVATTKPKEEWKYGILQNENNIKFFIRPDGSQYDPEKSKMEFEVISQPKRAGMRAKRNADIDTITKYAISQIKKAAENLKEPK